VLGAVVSAVGGLVVVLLVTRGYSQDVAGSLFATTSLFLIVLTVLLLGADAGLPRWLPMRLVQHQADEAARTVVVAVLPSLALALFVAVVGLAAAPWLAGVVVSGTSDALAASQLRVLALALPVAVVAGVLLAATRGYGSMRPTVLADRIAMTVLQALGVLLLIVLDADAVWLAVVWSAPYVASLLIALTWVRRQTRAAARLARPVPDAGKHADPRPDVAREYWRFTLPRVGVSVSQVMLRRLDVVLVAALVSASGAAVYTAASRFVVVAGLGVLGLQQALAPQLSRAFASHHHDQAQHLFQLATAWMMLVSWPVYLAVMALAPQLLQLFGEGYQSGTVVVVIASLGMLYGTSAGAVDTALVMSGHSVLSLLNSMAVLVVNVVLNIVLIPAYGILGAASAWAVSVVVRNVLAQVQVRRLEQLRLYGRPAAVAAVCVLLAFGPALAVIVLGQTSLVASVVLLLIAAAVYAGLICWPRSLQVVDLVLALRLPMSVRGRVLAFLPQREVPHGPA
jgi:O-antigen/teichoic acid export membrane protein